MCLVYTADIKNNFLTAPCTMVVFLILGPNFCSVSPVSFFTYILEESKRISASSEYIAPVPGKSPII